VPAIVGNTPVRLSNRTQYDLAQYVLNYVGNYGPYHEESRNCQTFAADLVRERERESFFLMHTL
jgi:hypothetical protein